MKVFNDFVILSKDASIDSSDDMISIFKIIDKFNFRLDQNELKRLRGADSNKQISLPAEYVVVSSWRLQERIKTPYNAVLLNEILDPSGKIIAQIERDVVFGASADRLRLRGTIKGIPVTKNGYYTYRLSILNKQTRKTEATAAARYEVEIALKSSEKEAS